MADASGDDDGTPMPWPAHLDLPVDSDVPEGARPVVHQGAAGALRERWDILLAIAAGGALGSLARWAVSRGWDHTARQMPWSTWVENVTGAFALGLLMVLIVDLWPRTRYLRPFLGVGLLGGYTTFSTYMLDTRLLLAAGEVPMAFVYLFGTLLTGLLAVWIGMMSARGVVSAAAQRARGSGRRSGSGPKGRAGR
jgi:CrcB protein